MKSLDPTETRVYVVKHLNVILHVILILRPVRDTSLILHHDIYPKHKSYFIYKDNIIKGKETSKLRY